MNCASKLDGVCVLVANRGECACRIIRTCSKLGVETVAIYTEHDQISLHTQHATKSAKVRSYMDIPAMVQAALDNQASAVHPGWGFQSENPCFEEACENAGLVFIGPTRENIEILGDKVRAKEAAIRAMVPVAPGSGILTNIHEALDAVKEMGYPIMIKPTDGGGGMNISICHTESDLRSSFSKTVRQTGQNTGSMYIEKLITDARHIEVQVFGDGAGNVALLGERDCSVQRRYQKIIEETPAHDIRLETRKGLLKNAKRIAETCRYRSAGTVEFIMDRFTEEYFFMEFNTRLQVEHGVTELCYGVDLVEWMIRLAYGCLKEHLGSRLQNWDPAPNGHAIEVRICAEDPIKSFQSSAGLLTECDIFQQTGTRVDTGVYLGYEISPLYDSMILKVLQWAQNRVECIKGMIRVLSRSKISGPSNNMTYINQFIQTQEYQSGQLCTSMLNTFLFSPSCFEVLSPGMMTTVQDWPGRTRQGLWRVGVPPSGAMDHLACRLSNILVGNEETAAVLEICITGPTLKFHCEAYVAVGGAPNKVCVNGEEVSQWACIKVVSGSILSIQPNPIITVGCRAYMSVNGGIDVPRYLGSRATFTSSGFGGYQGRVLRKGDMIPIIGEPNVCSTTYVLPSHLIPQYTNNWTIGCLPGPYADPDYFTTEDVEMFHATQWRVHHDSNRLGIRLIGPTPKWARADGGAGGSHPSNIHDYVYCVGSVNFTGNMPIIITQDGPSLGGFVCPVTIVQSELWKVGQLRPNDTVKFVSMDIDEANGARIAQNELIITLGKIETSSSGNSCFGQPTRALLLQQAQSRNHPGLQVRLAGDTNITVEYGPVVLDLNQRFRIHFLETKLLQANIVGLEETAPGVRSLQIRYNPCQISLQEMIDKVVSVDCQLPDVALSDLFIQSRILHLPLCFNHSGVVDAIKRYVKTVRKEAPYLPSNIDFIAKNNGLHDADEVYHKIFAATYMCLGLGDVYLNSPCATPLNPLHRLINPKYNPARTYTQEGTVGLGGAYMCIYTMDSPGGYQLVGRSLPIWNTHCIGNSQNLFSKEKPWLLRMFDQIRFFSVEQEELERMRTDFRHGTHHIKIEKTEFSIKMYNKKIDEIKEETKKYQQRQRDAAALMNVHEKESLARLLKEQVLSDVGATNTSLDQVVLGDNHVAIYASIPGLLSEVCVNIGDQIEVGDVLLVLCSMKVEHLTRSVEVGRIHNICVKPSDIVITGQILMILSKN